MIKKLIQMVAMLAAMIAMIVAVSPVGAGAQKYKVKSAVVSSGGVPGSSPNFRVTASMGSPVSGTGSSPSFQIEYDATDDEPENPPTAVDPGTTPTSRLRTYLASNYPNPFNPVTTIRYGIRSTGHVGLSIYNVRGQLVKTLVNRVQSPAELYEVRWDGRDDRGEAIASGVYFYRLVTRDFVRARKMVLLK